MMLAVMTVAAKVEGAAAAGMLSTILVLLPLHPLHILNSPTSLAKLLNFFQSARAAITGNKNIFATEVYNYIPIKVLLV